MIYIGILLKGVSVMRTKQNFKKNLKEILEKKNISRQTLSKKLNIPLSTINEWCRGNNCPRADMLDKLAACLDVSVIQLLRDTTDDMLLQSNIELSQFTDLNIDNRKKVIEFIQFLRMREHSVD